MFGCAITVPHANHADSNKVLWTDYIISILHTTTVSDNGYGHIIYINHVKHMSDQS